MSNPFNRYVYATSSANDESEKHELDTTHWFFGSSFNHHFEDIAWERAVKEVGCAVTASFLVSPMVSIIDKAIATSVTGSTTLAQGMLAQTKEMIFTPRTFLGGLAFRLTFIVYAGTYAVANLSEMALDIAKVRDDNKRKNMKVAASAVANIGLLAWRDSVFARVFSTSTVKRSTPFRTIGLFAARDAATMYATFYAAPKAAVYLQEHYEISQYPAEFSMALAIPVATQIITAPLHIHAMDFYNKPGVSTAERIAAIKKEFPSVSFARGFRILPAFGIGSFSNNRLREYFIRHEWDPEPVPVQRRLTNIVRRYTERTVEGVVATSSSSPSK